MSAENLLGVPLSYKSKESKKKDRTRVLLVKSFPYPFCEEDTLCSPLAIFYYSLSIYDISKASLKIFTHYYYITCTTNYEVFMYIHFRHN